MKTNTKKIIRLPLKIVKPLCIGATLLGILFVVAGSWVAGLCLLVGSYVMEKSQYRCPHCQAKMDMKRPLFRHAVCPACSAPLKA